jgi:hypothetical protein
MGTIVNICHGQSSATHQFIYLSNLRSETSTHLIIVESMNETRHLSKNVLSQYILTRLMMFHLSLSFRYRYNIKGVTNEHNDHS